MKSNSISPLKLAFDIDGVIADTFRTFVSIARNEYGISVEYEDIQEYNFGKVIEEMDETTGEQIVNQIINDPLGMGIQPVEGSVSVIERLSELGPLLFVTARPEKAGIMKWMNAHFHLNGSDRIHVVATGTHQDKIPVLLDLKVEYFVDDRLDTCYLLEKEAIVPIVFEQPWNRKPHPFQKVKSWDEISSIIEWG